MKRSAPRSDSSGLVRRQSVSFKLLHQQESDCGEEATLLLERKMLTLSTACLWTLWDAGTQRCSPQKGVHRDTDALPALSRRVSMWHLSAGCVCQPDCYWRKAENPSSFLIDDMRAPKIWSHSFIHSTKCTSTVFPSRVRHYSSNSADKTEADPAFPELTV